MSVTFDGVNMALDCGGSRNILNNVAGAAISCWFNITPNSQPGSQNIVTISVGNSTNARFSLEIGANSGILLARVRALDADAASTFQIGTPFVSGWNHAVLTANYTTALGLIYLNGVLAASSVMSTTKGNTSPTNPMGINIGCANDIVGFMKGSIADARIYSRLLPQDQVTTIYSARGDDNILSGLQARWPFKDLSPTSPIVICADVGPNAYGAVKQAAGGTPTYDTDPLILNRRTLRSTGAIGGG